MELEAKHLAPYLPFKLKMIFQSKGGRIIELSNITISKFGIAISGGHGAMMLKSSKFLPILVPLKELSAYSNGIKHRGYRTDDNNLLNLISDIESGRGNYDIMQLCFEEHIDVFGLIQAGLAIDINTLETVE